MAWQRWPLYRKGLLFSLTVLILAACGGPGKTGRVTGIYYETKQGDTLVTIAQKFQVNSKKLSEINKMSLSSPLKEGTIVFIPQGEPFREKGAVKENGGPKNGDMTKKPPSKPAKAKLEKTGDIGTAKEGSGAKGDEPLKKATQKKAKATNGHKKAAGADRDTSEQGLPVDSPSHPKKAQEKTATFAPLPPPPPARKPPVSQPLWGADSPPQVSAPIPKEPPRAKELQEGSKDTAKAIPSRSEVISSADKGRFSWPVKGKVANHFGVQPSGMYYNHIKIITRDNAPVSAAGPGTVIFSAPLKDFGETVIIKHDQRFATVYTHLGKRLVKVNQLVKKGDQIGAAEKTDTKTDGYINFEIRDHNKSRNPLLFLP
ncbi:MAG: hypothetical protein CSYNP_00319 [Syntrophus sp. SKADARSKE-3]|nr:hypothetical protein [Syntrophus sp. SKADARSKE-3]